MEKEKAIALLKEYNKDIFHIRHGITVGETMRYFAEKHGAEGEADKWYLVGLLHDIDFEMYPEEHCIKSQEILREAGLSEDIVKSAASHAYGLVPGDLPEPQERMEKILFASDELTGLIGAAALMRPSRSTKDMELSSLKKKFKDKRFAAGCDRDVIRKGAENLGWELDQLLEETLTAMKETEDVIEADVARYTEGM